MYPPSGIIEFPVKPDKGLSEGGSEVLPLIPHLVEGWGI